jgi:polyhydroxyalkanoate synthesis regulator protein
LETSIEAFTRGQGEWREQMAQAFGGVGFGAMEDQVRRNMEMFERTFALFVPFARREGLAAAEAEKGKEKAPGGELDEMKRRLEDMQKRIDQLTGNEKK